MKESAAALNAKQRLLRIYFVAEGRYQGEIDGAEWTGKVAWANKLSEADFAKTLQLADMSGALPSRGWWLTEFEDNWPYEAAAGDLYFSQSANQGAVKRPPIISYVVWPADAAVFTIAALLFWPFYRRVRRSAATLVG